MRSLPRVVMMGLLALVQGWLLLGAVLLVPSEDALGAALWSLVAGVVTTGPLARFHRRPPLAWAGWAWLTVAALAAATWVARAATGSFDLGTGERWGAGAMALVGLFFARRLWRNLAALPAPPAPLVARTARARDVAGFVEEVPGPVVFGQTWERGGPMWWGVTDHTLLDGPTGAGKTRRHLAQAVIVHKGPVLSTSTKADVAFSTSTARALRGRCWWLDPSGRLPVPPYCTPAAWSPLSGIHSEDDATHVAEQLVAAAAISGFKDADYFGREAARVLAPLVWAAVLANRPVGDLYRWVVTGPEEWADALVALEDDGADMGADLLRSTARALADEGARRVDSVLSTAAQVLGAYRYASVRERASSPNFDAGTFATSEGDTLYIVSPVDWQRDLAPLVVALVDQVMAARRMGWGPAPLLMALDELANISPLPDLSRYLTEGRGHGVTILGAVQTVAQFDQWGHQRAEVLRRAWPYTILYPGTPDLDLCREVSAALGDHLVTRTSTTTPKVGWLDVFLRDGPPPLPSTTEHHSWERVVRPEEVVGHLEPGSGWVRVLEGRRPAQVAYAPDIDEPPWADVRAWADREHAASPALDPGDAGGREPGPEAT